MTKRAKTLLMLAGAAAAVLSLAGFAAAADASLTPEQFIAARQATLDLSANVNGAMRDAMKAGREAKTQGYAAFALGRWARALPSLFPEGTVQGQTAAKTQAMAEIWRDRGGFEAAAANYAAQADKLSDLAKANDTEGFKAQLDVLAQACDACHGRFKAGDRRSPK